MKEKNKSKSFLSLNINQCMLTYDKIWGTAKMRVNRDIIETLLPKEASGIFCIIMCQIIEKLQ